MQLCGTDYKGDVAQFYAGSTAETLKLLFPGEPMGLDRINIKDRTERGGSKRKAEIFIASRIQMYQSRRKVSLESSERKAACSATQHICRGRDVRNGGMEGSSSALSLPAHKPADSCRKVANSLLDDLSGLTHLSDFFPASGREETRNTYRK